MSAPTVLPRHAGEKKGAFLPKKNKKSISLGNGESDHFEFSDNKPFETYKNYPGQVYFYILNLSSLFFDEEPLENILCICPCNLTASRFPDLILQNSAHFQVHEYECLANIWP